MRDQARGAAHEEMVVTVELRRGERGAVCPKRPVKVAGCITDVPQQGIERAGHHPRGERVPGDVGAPDLHNPLLQGCAIRYPPKTCMETWQELALFPNQDLSMGDDAGGN